MARAAAFEVLHDGRDRDSWLEARRVGIGGSDIGDVLGCGYGSPMGVYASKLGLAEPEPENAAMRFGKRYEALLAQDLEILTGRRTRLDGRLLRSTRYPWLLSTLDARQWERRRLFGAAELKTTRFEWETAIENDAWGGIPQHVFAQVQVQYLVTDFEVITCAVFNRLSCLTVYAEVRRDEPYQELVLERSREFWRRVELCDPPPPDETEATARALSKLYAQSVAGKVVELDGTWLDFADRWTKAKAAKKAAEIEERALKNELLAKLGEAEVGLLPDGGRFTARTVHRGPYSVNATSYRDLRLVERGD